MATGTPVAAPRALTIDLVVPAPKIHHIKTLLFLLSLAVIFTAIFVVEARDPVLANADAALLTGP